LREWESECPLAFDLRESSSEVGQPKPKKLPRNLLPFQVFMCVCVCACMLRKCGWVFGFDTACVLNMCVLPTLLLCICAQQSFSMVTAGLLEWPG
jgi:hypothetical protein